MINYQMTDSDIDRTRKLALAIKESIETSTKEQRFNRIDELYSKWIVQPNHTYNFFDYLKLALSNFDLSSENLQIGLFEKAKKVVIYELTYLQTFFNQDEMPIDVRDQYTEKFTKLFRSVIDADNALSSSLYLVSSMTQEEIGRERTTKHELFRYTEIDYDSASAYQSLLLYLFEQLQRKEYRRYVVDEKGMCYSRVYNTEGYDTHAWRQSTTVKNFILDVTRRELNYKMWQNLTAAKENLKAAANYLTEYSGPEFEDLYRERNIFSFTNGIYITKIWSEAKEFWTDQWIPYVGEGTKKIGASVVSCKLFDLSFEDCSSYEDWFDIIKKHCPSIMHIMEYQQWPEEVQRWLCISIGRLFYNVGELDDWQIIPFLLGLGGTGKCMCGNTPIFLYNGGIKLAKKIKVGDKIMGDDSKPRTVLTINKGHGKMYKIRQVSGDDYIVNGDHILSLKVSYIGRSGTTGKMNENRWIKHKPYKAGDIIDISVNDYLTLSQGQKSALVGYKVPVVFEEKEVPIDPYIIGLWLGDGSSSNVDFTNQDATILHYLAHKLPEYNCYLEKTPSLYGYRFQTLEKGTKKNYVKNTFIELNLLNNKHVPYIYKCNSRENQLKLLAGILDTDGSYDVRGHCYDIIQKNYDFAKDIQYIARCLGFTSNVVKCQKGCMYKGEMRTGTYYRQQISGNGIEDIPCLIPRKKASPRSQIKNNLHTGIKIEPLDEDDFYGFQIDGNQRFLLGDFTVTHNSTILDNVIKRLYEDADVGMLGSNSEKKFGLSALVGKKIFIAPEIRGDISLPQAEFLSMVSGETVSVNTKYKTAHSEKFNAPGFMAGNEAMEYKDSGGQVARRLLVFPHNFKVEKGKGDTKLGQKLQKEIPYIMQACNRAYLKTVEESGSSGIWDILPQFFKDTQELMSENNNSLAHFLKSDLVVVGKDYYCREKIFVAAFNEHCRESHFGNTKWTQQFYAGTFTDFGVKIVKNCRRRYPNKPNEKSYSGTFLFGVDIKEFAGTGNGNNDDDSEVCLDEYINDNMFE